MRAGIGNMKEQLFHVEGEGWYVRTAVVLEGPFATQAEAATYLALLKKVSAAGVACGWPVPHNKSETERQVRRAKILFEIALSGFGWVRRRRKNRAHTVH
jgi:hypothetical protein